MNAQAASLGVHAYQDTYMDECVTGRTGDIVDVTSTPDTTDPTSAPAAGDTVTDTTTNETIGLVYLPSSGTLVGRFEFLVDRATGRDVEIGAIVAADTREGTVVGAVVEMKTVGYAHDAFALDMLGATAPMDRRDEVMLATVQVFHSPSMRPIRAGTVRGATVDELGEATGAKSMDRGIPAGAVTLTGANRAAVSLDSASLLGPDAAHCLIGGISGQASKTSFAGVLLRSAIHHGGMENTTAAIVFNVKGDDLLYLDKPPAAGYELSENDLALYATLGIPPTPFPHVTVYAPAQSMTDMARGPRPDAHPLRWSLADIWKYLRYVWPAIYEDEKLSGFISSFGEQYLFGRSSGRRVDTLGKLLHLFDEEITEAEEENHQETRTLRLHIATARRLRRMFRNLGAELGGLVPKDNTQPTSDVPVQGLRPGGVYVVDLAGLSAAVQGMVIARTCERILESAEHHTLGVDSLVVFTDELNAYAPASGGDFKSVKRVLQRIATQGRYAGVSLWGAAQKLSKIDDLIRDNAATIALGRCAPAELDTGVYGKLPAGLHERLATLPRGQMALWHYTLRSAMVVEFPRPAWRTGKAKGAAIRPRPVDTFADETGYDTKSLDALSEGVDDQIRDRILSSASSAAEAEELLKQARTLDTKRVQPQVERPDYDPSNPFSI
jgi:uncharacterized protein